MSGPGYIRVRNWRRFQHYGDRRTPPWIKLYNDLLKKPEYLVLPDASKSHLVGIFLLASRYDNELPADPEWIGSRIGATEAVDLAVLGHFLEPIDVASRNASGSASAVSLSLSLSTTTPKVSEEDSQGCGVVAGVASGDRVGAHRRKMSEEKKMRARELRSNATGPERAMWQLLRRRRLGYKFRRQHPMFGWILDFWCPELALAIEVDGPDHDDPEQAAADEHRDATLADRGVTTLRVPAAKVVDEPAWTRQQIRGVIEQVAAGKAGRQGESGAEPDAGAEPASSGAEPETPNGAGSERLAVDVRSVLSYLNDLAGTAYQPGPETAYLEERLLEGWTPEQCEQAIEAAMGRRGELGELHPRRVFSRRWFNELRRQRAEGRANLDWINEAAVEVGEEVLA